MLGGAYLQASTSKSSRLEAEPNVINVTDSFEAYRL